MIRRMLKAYREGDETMLLSPAVFTRLFAKLYTSRENISCKAVVDLIGAVKKFRHETVTHAALLYAPTVCTWSHNEDAAVCAEKIWLRVQKPSLELLNLVLKACANHPLQAVSHRNAPKLLEDAEGSTLVTPNDERCSLVIEAAAKSKVANAAQKSFYLFQRFKPRVTNQALTHVLHAYAMTPVSNVGAKPHNYYLANRAFNVRRARGGTANSHHYLLLLTCAIRLAPDTKARLTMTKHIFRQCAGHGMVDDKVLRRFWSLAPQETRLDLLDRVEDKVPLSTLPHDWAKNHKKCLWICSWEKGTVTFLNRCTARSHYQ